MNRVGVVLLAGCWVGCGAGDRLFEPVGSAVATVLAEALRELRAHPGALRATLGLTCGSEAICAGGPPEEGDRCSSEAAIWSEDFARSFDVCLASGELLVDCFEGARAAHAASPEQGLRAQQCREGLQRCGELESDGCAALEALVDPGLTQQVMDCAAASCDQAENCFMGALATGTPKAPDPCELHLLFKPTTR